jgi:3-oxoadipate enol-lactonase
MRLAMAILQSGGCPLHAKVEGPADAPALMLSNSLGTDMDMWLPQLDAFTKHFRVVRFDRRGHGRSGVTDPPYSMELLGRDALAIIDGLGLTKVNWCGLSMGGMEGQWLGANAPDRIDRLVLCNTSSFYPDKQAWADRIAAVRANGTAAMAEGVAARWFTKDFIERAPDQVEHLRDMVRHTTNDGYIGCCEAIRDMDHRDLLARIAAPTLVIAGKHDMATPVEAGEFIRDRIPDATMTVLDAAHISNVERAAEFTAAVLGFLNAR